MSTNAKNKIKGTVNKKSKAAPIPKTRIAKPSADATVPKSKRPVLVDLDPSEFTSAPQTPKKLSPQQQRFADQKKNNAPMSNGRPPGTPNKTTTLLKVIAIGAIERLGYDGKGKDGALGWMMYQAKYNRDEYLKFLGKLLPLQLNVADTTPRVYESLEEIVEGFKKRGLPVPPDLMKTVSPARHGEVQLDPDDEVEED